MAASAWFGAVLFGLGVALFVCYARTGKMLRCILFTATTGLLALSGLWLLGLFWEVGVAVTPFTLLGAAILGIPGVLGMLVLAML